MKQQEEPVKKAKATKGRGKKQLVEEEPEPEVEEVEDPEEVEDIEEVEEVKRPRRGRAKAKVAPKPRATRHARAIKKEVFF